MSKLFKVEWRPVLGYEGFYEVSSLGEVRSLGRSWAVTGTNLVAKLRPRILKQDRTTNGYSRVCLAVAGAKRQLLVHRLVCRAFHGEAGPQMIVRHLDGDKSRNHVENLAWGTYSQNNGDDKRAQGTILRGERHHKAKLSESDVKEIRAIAATTSRKEIAERFGVCKRTVQCIVHNETWRHV